MAPPELPGFHATTSLSVTADDRTWPSRVVRCGLPTAVVLGFPCFMCIPSMHAVVSTPVDRQAAFVAACALPRWPSPNVRQVGFRINRFEASSSVHLRYGLYLRGITK